MKKIYISGSISKNPDYKEDFKNKENELIKSGWIVLSPTFIYSEINYEDYLHIDFAMIDVCDAVYVMKNFMQSEGSLREIRYAERLGKKIIYEK